MKKYLLLFLITAVVGVSCSPKKERTIMFSNEDVEHLAKFVNKDEAYKGKVSYKINPDQLYGPTWNFFEKDINLNEFSSVTFDFRVKNLAPSDSVEFVFGIEDKNGKNLKFESMNLTNADVKNNPWKLYSVTYSIEQIQEGASKYFLFFLNSKKKEFYVDDFKMNVK